MKTSPWVKGRRLLTLGAGILMLIGEAHAQAPPASAPPSTEELLRRLELLEQSNQELRQQLQAISRPAAPAADPAPAAAPDSPGAAAPKAAAAPTSEEGVKKLIADYLKDQEDKKKAAAATPAPYRVGTALTGFEAKYVTDSISSWGNGLIVSSPNKDFIYHVGGCLQTDVGFYNPSGGINGTTPGANQFSDGVTPRRLRLRTDGTIYEFMDFAVETEVFNGFEAPGTGVVGVPPTSQLNETRTVFTPGLTDGWIRFKDLPVVGNLRVGNQKEPISLERLNNFQDLTFMERSIVQDAFAGENIVFVPGIMIYNTYWEKRGTWWLGLFKNIDNLSGFGTGDGQLALDGRVTYLPFYINNGDYLWHVGASASHRDPINGAVVERVRDPIRANPAPLLPNLVNTGPIGGSSQDLFYLESAFILGPVTINSEYTQSYLHNAINPVTGVNGGTYATNGGYVEVLTFLTGDHRTYDLNNAVEGRTIPNDPFFPCGHGRGRCFGTGAWEVGVRYSVLNLNQAGVLGTGGNLNDVTLGLNWYLNTMMKLQFNYDYINRANAGLAPSGSVQAFGSRLQVSF